MEATVAEDGAVMAVHAPGVAAKKVEAEEFLIGECRGISSHEVVEP